MSYIDWEYYQSHAPKLTESEFLRFLPQAEMRVEIETHRRSRTACGYKMDQVKACVVHVINALAVQEETGAGTGIASVSNGGYSESYVNMTEEQADAQIHSLCRKWLSGTGLMGAL